MTCAGRRTVYRFGGGGGVGRRAGVEGMMRVRAFYTLMVIIPWG